MLGPNFKKILLKVSFKPNPSIFAWPYLAHKHPLYIPLTYHPYPSMSFTPSSYTHYHMPSILHFTFSLLPTHSHSHTNHIYALLFILSPPLTVQTYFSSKFPSLGFLDPNISFLIKFGRLFLFGEPLSNFL